MTSEDQDHLVSPVEVSAEIVAELREKLAQAERGEIVGLSLAVTYADGKVGTRVHLGIGSDAYRMAGAIAALVKRFADHELVPDPTTEFVKQSFPL